MMGKSKINLMQIQILICQNVHNKIINYILEYNILKRIYKYQLKLMIKNVKHILSKIRGHLQQEILILYNKFQLILNYNKTQPMSNKILNYKSKLKISKVLYFKKIKN